MGTYAVGRSLCEYDAAGPACVAPVGVGGRPGRPRSGERLVPGVPGFVVYGMVVRLERGNGEVGATRVRLNDVQGAVSVGAMD